MRKGAPGSTMEINPVFKEIKKLKESSMLSGNKGNGDLRERF